MHPQFWHERWRNGEIGWHANAINLHLQAHWHRLGAGPGERVFVPLCGKSLDLLWLASQGHRVLGVEISRIAVDSFFAENRLSADVVEQAGFLRYRAAELEILCGDYFDLTPELLAGVTAVFDRASLIAMPPERRPRYAEHLRILVGGDARALLITLVYDQSEMAGPPFSVPEEEVRGLFGQWFEIQLAARVDVLAENEGFRERGLTSLTEQVYVLRSLK